MDDKAFELLTKMYSEFTNKIDGLLESIDNKLEKQGVEITVIKGGKKKKVK